MTLPLYLLHGWACDASLWHPMLSFLPNTPAILADQGYFNTPNTPPLPSTPFLAIGHSAGTLSLLAQPLPNCVGIISFNGFPRFSQAPDFPQGVPPRILNRMARTLLANPITTLTDFRTRHGLHTPLPASPNIPRLAQGLDHLLHSDHRSQAEHQSANLHWIAGRSDPLSPALSGFTHSGIRLEGGHFLPLEAPETCAKIIQTLSSRYDP